MLAPANFTVLHEMHTACSMLMGWRTSKALRSCLSKHLSYLLAVCLKACTDREIMERFSFVCSYRARRFGQIVINSSRLPSLGCLLCRGSMLEKHHVFGDETRKTCEVLFTDMHYFNRQIPCLAFRSLLFEENQLVARPSGANAVGRRWETLNRRIIRVIQMNQDCNGLLVCYCTSVDTDPSWVLLCRLLISLAIKVSKG